MKEANDRDCGCCTRERGLENTLRSGLVIILRDEVSGQGFGVFIPQELPTKIWALKSPRAVEHDIKTLFSGEMGVADRYLCIGAGPR